MPYEAKFKLRDKINVERKKNEEEEIRKEGGDMAKPTSSKQAGVTVKRVGAWPITQRG